MVREDRMAVKLYGENASGTIMPAIITADGLKVDTELSIGTLLIDNIKVFSNAAGTQYFGLVDGSRQIILSPSSTITVEGAKNLVASNNPASVYFAGIHKGTYSINSGSWTVPVTGFTGLDTENFPYPVINCTTGEVYSTTNATFSGTLLTLDSSQNTGMTAPATGNDLLIPILDDYRAYDTSLDLIKTAEQSPLDEQVLNEKLMDAVTGTVTSSSAYVLDRKNLTLSIIATSVSTGGTFVFEGSPDDTNWGTLASVGNTGALSTTQEITGNGTTIYDVTNASSLKYVRARISGRTDGTYTCYVQGRA